MAQQAVAWARSTPCSLLWSHFEQAVWGTVLSMEVSESFALFHDLFVEIDHQLLGGIAPHSGVHEQIINEFFQFVDMRAECVSIIHDQFSRCRPLRPAGSWGFAP